MKFEIFSSKNLGQIRVAFATADGTPWFVAKDVCECLGIKNVSYAVSRLLSDEKSTVFAETSGGRQKVIVVSESGLYTLVMSARKKEAVDFQRWVTRVVLPSIREHGAYVMGQEDLTAQAREELLQQVNALAKKAKTFEEDSNYWFEMYSKLLDEYTEASESLVASGKYVRNDNGGVQPVDDRLPEGFIINAPKSGIWTDRQGFVIDVPDGNRYQIIEREMR